MDEFFLLKVILTVLVQAVALGYVVWKGWRMDDWQ